MLDLYGRDIIITHANNKDIYTVGGISLSFPEGTVFENAFSAINSMAPVDWTFPFERTEMNMTQTPTDVLTVYAENNNIYTRSET